MTKELIKSLALAGALLVAGCSKESNRGDSGLQNYSIEGKILEKSMGRDSISFLLENSDGRKIIESHHPNHDGSFARNLNLYVPTGETYRITFFDQPSGMSNSFKEAKHYFIFELKQIEKL
jgi:hypothetical protein